MSSPQDQTVTPLPTDPLVATTQQTLICQTEDATDSDRMSRPTYSISIPESVTYTWSLEDNTGRVVFTSGASSTSYTRLLLPATPGVYVLKCKIDDPWADGQNPAVTGVTPPEEGRRNDAALVRAVQVNVVKVKFVEDPDQAYGFDDWTNRDTTLKTPWKSVGIDQTDTAFAEITPPAAFPQIKFTSSDLTRFEVVGEPLTATSARHKVPVKGYGRTDATREAHVVVHAVGNPANIPDTMNVAVYDVKSLRVGIALVHRQGGDVQEIQPGQGPGITNPNAVCVSAGPNNRLDTRLDPNDRLSADGLSIVVGPDGICQSIANHNAVNIPQADVEAYLKKVYKQAAVEWTVTRLPERIVNFDLNDDGALDVGTQTTGPAWNTAEQQVVMNAYTVTEKHLFHKIVFLAASPSMNYGGIAGIDYNNQYAFVFADRISAPTPPSRAVAHELGHALSLLHTPELDAGGNPVLGSPVDPENIMYTLALGDLWRLRKFQWDAVNRLLEPRAFP